MNEQVVRDVTALLVDTTYKRKPDAEYRFVPAEGWHTLDGEPCTEPPVVGIVPIEALEPMPAYTLVHNAGRTVYRLVREPKVSWYYVNQLELDENDTVIYRYYTLSTQQIATLLLDYLSDPPPNR